MVQDVVQAAPQRTQTGAPAKTASPPPTGPGTVVADRDFRTFCETAPCRRNIRIHLLRKDGTWYDLAPELLPPMIQGGLVTVYPGDKVRLLPVFDSNGFKEWRVAPDQVDEATVVITIEFRQMEADKPGMVATISKNAGPAMKFSVGMFVVDGPDDPVKTSTCPLAAGKFSNTEFWPYPIHSLLFAPPAMLDSKARMVCE